MEKYLAEMKEILEVDSLEMNDELSSFDAWDSLTILELLALFSSEYDITISAEEIENSHTIGGLKALIDSKK